MSIYSFNQGQKPTEMSEQKVIDNELGTEQTKANIKEIAQQEGKDSGKEKVVVVDGPLSHVYTQALNIAFANESVSMMNAVTTAEPRDKNNPGMSGDENKDAEYVYVLGDRISEESDAMEAYNNISKAIATNKYKKVHLVIEGAMSGKMCKRTSIVVESALKLGVKVVTKGQFGMENAVLDLSRNIRISD